MLIILVNVYYSIMYYYMFNIASLNLLCNAYNQTLITQISYHFHTTSQQVIF